jgi:N-acylglucosamine 2-epimerase
MGRCVSNRFNRLPIEPAGQLREQYRAALLDDVIRWWQAHSVDRECGGYFSLLERDGHPYATDKSMWTTGREIWMLSHLYNTYKQQAEWLEIARYGVDFLLQHAFRDDFCDDGKMFFRLTRDGRQVSNVLSIYAECFGAIALFIGSPAISIFAQRFVFAGQALTCDRP